MNKTLLKGWWGILSALRNLGAIAINLKALLALRGLREGMPHLDVEAPLTGPLDKGRSVFARSGIWVTVLAAWILLGAVVGNASADSSVDANKDPLAIGQCVQAPRLVFEKVVDCSQQNSGTVVAVARTANECPNTSSYYFEKSDGTRVYCIGFK